MRDRCLERVRRRSRWAELGTRVVEVAAQLFGPCPLRATRGVAPGDTVTAENGAG